MIKIDKSSIQKPTVLDDEKIKKLLKKRIKEEKPGEKIKQPYNDKAVRTALEDLYHDKCGYCEVKIPKGSSRIDHYRPKTNIKGVQNHKGYFGLGYEWTNFVLACEPCNGAAHKSNKFPLKAESYRISDDLEQEGFIDKKGNFLLNTFDISSNILQKEQRLLLNPEIDDMYKHLYFTPDGVINAITEEGKCSIATYGLNARDLVTERKKILDRLINQLVKMQITYTPSEYTKPLNLFFETEIQPLDEPDKIYSRFGYFIKNHFEFFVVKRLAKIGLERFAVIVKIKYENWKSS